MDLGVIGIDRPLVSRPGPIFDKVSSKRIPLPTNSWLESLFLGETNSGPNNRVFQVPYIIDTGGYIQGVRAHPAHVQANSRQVEMTFEERNGLTVGAVERFGPQHHLIHDNTHPHGVARLSAVLEWSRAPSLIETTQKVPIMRSPIVRGAPYVTMEYLDASPRVYVQRALASDLLADSFTVLKCGSRLGEFSQTPVLVTKDLTMHFDTADTTWILFVSEPMEFVCSNVVANKTRSGGAPGVVASREEGWQLTEDSFELRAIKPVAHGMIRVAMTNNCTAGQNPINCERIGRPRDQRAFTKILRDHADVYPTGDSDIHFVFPVVSTEEEELRLQFNWMPASMKELKGPLGVTPGPLTELIMYALPHHQERVLPIVGSSNEVLDTGCVVTIHGNACLIKGGQWSLLEHLHRIGFNAPRPPRREMVADIRRALALDLQFQIPDNYKVGAGDTYFSGKMLAKLARVLLIADEVGNMDAVLTRGALKNLQEGIEIWLNGSALSPLLYDKDWGGMVSCGCFFNYTTWSCSNRFPDCPALVDAGFNFGAGFYNDHHFHYGYHIYAAAVAAHFDHAWGRKFHQRVLLLIRDIANPSASDPYFPTWRHKDWYLGSSWASGIVTISGDPYPNGRNQESSSESISAYEAVALYGEVAVSMYQGSADPDDGVLLDSAQRIRDMGRLLLATEIRSAKTYWHVRQAAPNVTRIYPEVYASKVVGMLWSMLAQEQTWFGNEAYKSYGIQLMPLTPAAEQRDTPAWIQEMLPLFNASCAAWTGCEDDGWSVLVLTSMATAGDWREAWRKTNLLADSVFDAAGGNGHSRSNTLWYIATRPDLWMNNVD